MTRPSALATRNIDLLWDTRKRILFSTQLARVDSSMRGVLKKVGSSSLLRWTSFAASKPVTTHTLSNSATRPKAFGSPRPAAPMCGWTHRASLPSSSPPTNGTMALKHSSSHRLNGQASTFITCSIATVDSGPQGTTNFQVNSRECMRQSTVQLGRVNARALCKRIGMMAR